MNARPENIDFETGEVFDDPVDSRSPLQIARSELAAFKFKLIETVAADPWLKKAPCTEAIVVYLSFVSIDKRTLKPTPAYASTIKLMARGKMKSKTTARLARSLLAARGYLATTGSSTKDGCVWFRVENPHADTIKMHVAETETYWKEIEAARRKEDRRKKQASSKPDVGPNIDPTEISRGDNNWPDVGPDIDPNYLRGNLSSLGTEGEELFQDNTTLSGYGSVSGDNPNLPYAKPESREELELMLAEFRSAGLAPAVIGYFREQRIAGTLTPAMVEQQLRFAS
ncbi:hypothetical protein [Mesorhizobium sp. A623]